MIELLTSQEMARADALTAASGRPVQELMLAAGQAVRDAAVELLDTGASVYVLCGTGNNGGDGFVAARLLQEGGHDVRVGLVGDPGAMRGDAAAAAALWHGPVERVNAGSFRDVSLIVDALFGAGLSRDVDGEALEAVRLVNRAGARVLAVDVPSGVDGTTGRVRGEAVQADATITFFRFKPGHLLLPGRQMCGRLQLAQIGIEPAVLDDLGARAWLNRPALWQGRFPVPGLGGHKYGRGHALIAGGAT
jgi:ADP-dependent NAD(P)H-hydrate dehydratase / NAD(P)H-hydrate epimerase